MINLGYSSYCAHATLIVNGQSLKCVDGNIKIEFDVPFKGQRDLMLVNKLKVCWAYVFVVLVQILHTCGRRL